MAENVDVQVVKGFGDEWSRFDQSGLSGDELTRMFDNYFNIFPWKKISDRSIGFDLGCGSGRWAKLVAPRVGEGYLVDSSSDALGVARRNLQSANNCHFHLGSVEGIPVDDVISVIVWVFTSYSRY